MTERAWDMLCRILWWGCACMAVGLLAVAFHYGYRALVSDTFVIPSDSMQPTLLAGDKVRVDKTIFGARLYTSLDFTDGRMESIRTRGRRGLRHNDIAVFNYPVHEGRIGFKMNHVYVKRCLALPGDTISFVRSHPVNSHFRGTLGVPSGQRMLEETPDSLMPGYAMRNILVEWGVLGYTIKNIPPTYVPRKGDILRLDDWRKAEIYRRAIEWETGRTLAWDKEKAACLLDGEPLDYYRFRKNYYFMCGDHALNSGDSRYWGFVPEEYIVGVVSEVVESVDPLTGRERKERRGMPLPDGEEKDGEGETI